MSTTFERLTFRDAREDADGKITVEFLTKDMKHGRSYTLNPQSTNHVARRLSADTINGILSYGKKKHQKRGYTLMYALSKLKGVDMICEIHDEVMAKFESHRLQTVMPRMKLKKKKK